MIYAVIDTNILVSALITHNQNASTVKILESLYLHRFTPVYNDEIIAEYEEVLVRAKFKLSKEHVHSLIDTIKSIGIDAVRIPYDCTMPDEDDRVFYEISLSVEDSFLVTGNIKHFPNSPKVVTAAQMVGILGIESYVEEST